VLSPAPGLSVGVVRSGARIAFHPQHHRLLQQVIIAVLSAVIHIFVDVFKNLLIVSVQSYFPPWCREKAKRSGREGMRGLAYLY
jgi:hypothetical protein